MGTPAVAQAAADSGVALRPIADMDAYRERLQGFVYASGTMMKPIFAAAKSASRKRVAYAEGEEERVLRAAVSKDRYNPFAWYQLGVVYAANGDIPRARLASAEQLVMNRRYPEALQNAQAAEANLPYGSADWIRAQDVALEARAELERMRDKK